MRTLLGLFLAFALLSCCSSRVSEKSHTESPRQAPPPNAMQQNSSEIQGVVDSVLVTGDTDFRISLFVRSAAQQQNGFAAQGDHVTAMPQFVLTDSGAIDLSSDRNKVLLKLRSAKAGDVVHCKISLDSKGQWHLYDVSP